MLRYTILTAIVLSCITLTLGLTGRAQALTTITKCGTIGASGSYDVAPGGLHSSSGDCLIVAAPNVSIECGGTPSNPGVACGISGSGSGAGIHFLSSATNGSVSIVTGGISGFNIGVQDDANLLSVSVSGDFGPSSTNASSYGIYLNHVSNSSVSAFSFPNTIGGGIAGVLINGGGRNSFAAPPVSDLSVSGSTYGIHIQGSNGNTINGARISATSSFGQGVFIEGGSSGNLLYQNNVTAGQFGIRVKSDSPANFILENKVDASQFDLFQGTTSGTVNCNGDQWLNNTTSGDSLTMNVACPQP